MVATKTGSVCEHGCLVAIPSVLLYVQQPLLTTINGHIRKFPVRIRKVHKIEPTPTPKKCVEIGYPRNVLMPDKTGQSQKKYTDSVILRNATLERGK